MEEFDCEDDYYKAQREQFAKLYGGNFIQLRMTKTGNMDYFCELCMSTCNGKRSLDSHCQGMKHLKKRQKWYDMGRPPPIMFVRNEVENNMCPKMSKRDDMDTTSTQRFPMESGKLEPTKGFNTRDSKTRDAPIEHWNPEESMGARGFNGPKMPGDNGNFRGSRTPGDRGDFRGSKMSDLGDFRGPRMPGDHGGFRGPRMPGDHGDFRGPRMPGDHGDFRGPRMPGDHGDFRGPRMPGDHGGFRGSRMSDRGDFNEPRMPGDRGDFRGPSMTGEHGDFGGPRQSRDHGDIRGPRFDGDRENFRDSELARNYGNFKSTEETVNPHRYMEHGRSDKSGQSIEGTKRSLSISPSSTPKAEAVNTSESFLDKVTKCSVENDEDWNVAVGIVAGLTKSLREYYQKNDESKLVELLAESEIKLGTAKALKLSVNMLKQRN